MKKVFLLLLFLSGFVLLYGQSNNPEKAGDKLGISLSVFGSNDLITFQILEGAPGYNGKGFYSLGVSYSRGLSSWLSFEGGASFARHTIQVIPIVPPEILAMPHNSNISLISFPLLLRVDFLKYFFVNGGLLVDFDITLDELVDNQSGIGSMLGVGFGYDFKSGISLYANPYVQAHTLLPFMRERYHERLLEQGIRFGVTYRLNK